MPYRDAIHGHVYSCKNVETGAILECDKLPPILKAIRIETEYTFKIPHGNRVRTMILEEGVCRISNTGQELYEITIKRW